MDHVLASGRNVNLLILDTEVYSNTGGQNSKATPLGAVAKFAAGGKATFKKDLAMMAMAYENVYVAQVAFGAKDVQTVRAFLEAESYDGPSVIIAYSPCIAHGVDLSNNLRQQDLAVNSGHWGLFRYDPRRTARRREPAADRQQAAEHPLSGLHLHRDPLQRPEPHPPGCRGALSAAGPEARADHASASTSSWRTWRCSGPRSGARQRPPSRGAKG